MRYLILYVFPILCDRLLRLKSRAGLYVTNSNGLPKLEPHTLLNLPNQRVVIHKRILYFLKDGLHYTFAMMRGKTDVELVTQNGVNERDVGFLVNSTLEPHRRKVSPFSHLVQNKSDRDQSAEDRSGVNGSSGGSTQHKFVVTERKNFSFEPGSSQRKVKRTRGTEKSFVSVDRAYDGQTNDGKEEDFVENKRKARDEMKFENVERSIPTERSTHESPKNSYRDIGTNIPSSTPSHHHELNKDVEHNNRITKISDVRGDVIYDSPKTMHFIESDSKMDDYGLGYVVRNVLVSEIDHRYFTLVTGGNYCMTYYRNSFVFMPCSFAEDQIFMLENSEDIKKDEMKRLLVNNSTSMETFGYRDRANANTGVENGEKSENFRREGSFPDDKTYTKNRKNVEHSSKVGKDRNSKRIVSDENSSVGTESLRRLGFDGDFMDRFKQILSEDGPGSIT